jgi:hypothetical protein
MKWSFVELHDTFSKAPVLAHFDHTKSIRHESDDSSFAVAGIISQQQDKVCSGAKGAVRGAKGN